MLAYLGDKYKGGLMMDESISLSGNGCEISSEGTEEQVEWVAAD
jgi:hypothetical protein